MNVSRPKGNAVLIYTWRCVDSPPNRLRHTVASRVMENVCSYDADKGRENGYIVSEVVLYDRTLYLHLYTAIRMSISGTFESGGRVRGDNEQLNYSSDLPFYMNLFSFLF